MEQKRTEEMQEKEQPVRSTDEGENQQAQSGGISPLAWRVFNLAWLVFLLSGVFDVVQAHSTPVRLGIALLVLFCFAILYAWLVWPHPLSLQAQKRARARFIWLPFILFLALTLFLNLAYGSAWLWFFIFPSVAAGAIFPTCRAGLVIFGLTLLTAGLGIVLTGADWQQFAIPVLLVGGIGIGMTGTVRSFGTIRELQLARSELARLAVIEERFRLARDLHDLLGHKLSMITLKSELAGRLIEKAPDRAVKGVHDIEQVARQTLCEVREAVAGYRQPRLESELDAARQMLEAAGISCSITQAVGTLPPPTDAVLAWTVREGVTNVIRHSRAHQCVIRLTCEQGTVLAEVVNDGYQKQDGVHKSNGTGLAGVSERVAVMGGRFEAGPLRATGAQQFRLWIELPLLNSVGALKEL